MPGQAQQNLSPVLLPHCRSIPDGLHAYADRAQRPACLYWTEDDMLLQREKPLLVAAKTVIVATAGAGIDELC